MFFALYFDEGASSNMDSRELSVLGKFASRNRTPKEPGVDPVGRERVVARKLYSHWTLEESMHSLLRDIRYSVRLLLKRPASAAVVVFTLALGIGANTAVFTVINALLVRPLPYANSDRIMYVWESRHSDPSFHDSLSPHNFTDIRSQNHSFQSYFAYQYTNLILTGNGQPESLTGVRASGDIGAVLGVGPAIGRLFAAAEDIPGKNQVAVLSDSLWRRRFGANPAIAGSVIQLDGVPCTIIGVMPSGFSFPSSDVDVWVPLALDLSKFERGTSFLTTVGKLKAGVTVNQAQSDLDSIGRRLMIAYPDNIGSDFALKAESLQEHLFGKLERPLMILFGAVMFVLLIACVNVANLMLGRSAARTKEMAVRTALGASRRSLLSLLLVEGVVLAIAGGIIGLLLATWGVQILSSINPEAISKGTKISMDASVLAFTLVLSIFTGVLFGLAPAWHTARMGLSRTLHENSRSSTGSSSVKFLRSTLVVVEISLSLVLLLGAGVLLRSLWNVMEVNPGFDPRNVVTCVISLSKTRYDNPTLQSQFFRQTLEAARNISGVESAGLATSMPFSGSRGASSFSIDGRTDPNARDMPEADRHQVSPGYFHAMKIPFRSGRDFTDNDNVKSQQVVIINQAAAKRFWPGENPIGKHITIGMPSEVELYGNAVSREIVGVIGNVKHENLTDDFAPEMYIPAWQLPAAGMTLVVRGQASAESILAEVRRIVLTVDPQQPVRSVKVLTDSMGKSMAPQRFLTTLLIVFAALAVILALVGIYAVMSFSVTQRIQEIGVRMALGATPGDALNLILLQGVALAAIGILTGILIALGVTNVMKGLLFEISASDPLTIVVVSLVLLIVTLAACLLPARRATRIDPMVALRYE